MSFGLSNAPPTFSRAMNYVFSEFKNDFMVVYLDDILVFSKTKEEHAEHIRNSSVEAKRTHILCQVFQV